ncbi:hypothetical protein A2U01_0114064, partial [Trifolium medium]|nr:hypothetical protein [Trifolium medium]
MSNSGGVSRQLSSVLRLTPRPTHKTM